MIISCPQCGTAYDVPDGASFVGRKVRCKACQSVWRVEAQAAPLAASRPGEEWADPMAMLNEGSNGAAASPQAISEPVRPAFGQKVSAAPVATSAAAPSPASGEPKAADFGWPDWPAEGETPATTVRKAVRRTPAEAAAETGEPGPSAKPASLPEDGAISPSMAASLERRRQARQRSGFDDVEAAIAAVRTAPASSDPGSAPTTDERDRLYRQATATAPQPGRDPFADAADFGRDGDEDPHLDYEDGEAPIDHARASRAGLIVGWVALASVVGGVVAFAILGADLAVRGLPGLAPVYASLGMPVNPRGLAFKEIAYEWKLDPRGKPVLAISGKVMNVSKEPRPVSSVVFAFIDQDGLELFDWATSIRAKALQPGSSLPFASVAPVPADAVRKVEVRFAKPRRSP